MKFTVSLIFLTAVFLSPAALAQEPFIPYYVVIGGFAKEENAQRYLAYAEEQNLPAVYAYNEQRKIFYVYVRATQDKAVADEILKRLQSTSVFKDSWVFNGLLSGSDVVAKKTPPSPTKVLIEDAIDEVIVPSEPEDKSPRSGTEDLAPMVETPKPIGKPFVFQLLNANTGSAVNGLVRLQESEKALQFRGYNGNEKVYVAQPSNRSGKWYVVCDVVGFKKHKKQITYAKAKDMEGVSVGSEQEIIIPLRLDRVRKGDYVELEGVKFFHNTALFTPGSERELEELYIMMVENPDYQVRLHGHTNGNEARDIVSIGESTNFFNPDVANAKSQGSAKELSRLRGELVKAYLINKGIEASRISVKGEGGKQALFESSGTLAGMNDRVEVEITKH